jgi:hypothetical protein
MNLPIDLTHPPADLKPGTVLVRSERGGKLHEWHYCPECPELLNSMDEGESKPCFSCGCPAPVREWKRQDDAPGVYRREIPAEALKGESAVVHPAPEPPRGCLMQGGGNTWTVWWDGASPGDTVNLHSQIPHNVSKERFHVNPGMGFAWVECQPQPGERFWLTFTDQAGRESGPSEVMVPVPASPHADRCDRCRAILRAEPAVVGMLEYCPACTKALGFLDPSPVPAEGQKFGVSDDTLKLWGITDPEKTRAEIRANKFFGGVVRLTENGVFQDGVEVKPPAPAGEWRCTCGTSFPDQESEKHNEAASHSLEFFPASAPAVCSGYGRFMKADPATQLEFLRHIQRDFIRAFQGSGAIVTPEEQDWAGARFLEWEERQAQAAPAVCPACGEVTPDGREPHCPFGPHCKAPL